MWFTVITLTTIGYGDISPGTKPGKVIVIVLAFWGALLLSLLVVVMNSIFSLDNKHKLAVYHIKQTRQAAQAICQSILYYRAKQDARMLKKQID